MKERINAVQRTFWALLAVGVAVTAIGVPVGNDAELMSALDEVEAFAHGFDRAKLEQTLLVRARAQGLVPIASVARAVKGREVPRVSAAQDAAPLQPRASIALASLADVHALTAQNPLLPIGLPDAAALGSALGWRLSRVPDAKSFVLSSISLRDGGCSKQDVAREQQVAAERERMLEARAQAEAAQKQYDGAAKLSELRRKWHAPWKAVLKADEKRGETQAALDAKNQQLAQADRSYQVVAKQAESFAASKGTAGTCAVASAALIEKPSGRAFQLQVPVPIEQRGVPVPRIRGAEFPVLQAAGLWNELKGGSAEQAIERLNQRFSWHYRHIEVVGSKLGGMTLLQFAPLALLPFFLGLMRKSRGVGATYNPFGERPQVEQLPTVGFGSDALNLLVLVVLPLTGSVLCAWSLVQIGQAPIVPALCALAAVGLGGSSHLALKRLLELRDAITRSHSHPPPAPSTST